MAHTMRTNLLPVIEGNRLAGGIREVIVQERESISFSFDTNKLGGLNHRKIRRHTRHSLHMGEDSRVVIGKKKKYGPTYEPKEFLY